MRWRWIRSGRVIVLLVFILSACRSQAATSLPATDIQPFAPGEATSTSTPPPGIAATLSSVSQVQTPETASASATAQRTPTGTVAGSVLPSQTSTPVSPQPSPTAQDSAYPGPLEESYPGPIQPAYPGPIEEAYPGPIQPAYPGPVLPGSTSYPGPGDEVLSAQAQSSPTALPTQTRLAGGPSPTPVLRLTATPISVGDSGAFSPLVLPQTGSNPALKIWHSLEDPDLAALEDVIRAFQGTFPQVSIDLTYVPLNDLRNKYIASAYHKMGPDLLLGPSEWAADLYDQGLVAGLRGYFPLEFWQALLPVALDTGWHRGAQVSLPVTMSGVVLYRNVKIIPQASTEFETMVKTARLATQGGIVGAYFELDPLYSMAHMQGIGGQWQDSFGRPIFSRQDYTDALAWLALLEDFDRLGAVELNTSRDLTLFRQGKVGWMIGGTWDLEKITADLGRGNFALDAWPEYGSGKLSGYVFSQGFYLNSETAANADARLMAALQFIGSAVLPQSQQRLSEDTSFLPVSRQVQLSDLRKIQAVRALETGTAFPPVWRGEPFDIYRLALQTTIRQVFGLSSMEQTPGISALQQAYQTISDWFASQIPSP